MIDSFCFSFIRTSSFLVYLTAFELFLSSLSILLYTFIDAHFFRQNNFSCITVVSGLFLYICFIIIRWNRTNIENRWYFYQKQILTSKIRRMCPRELKLNMISIVSMMYVLNKFWQKYTSNECDRRDLKSMLINDTGKEEIIAVL